MWLQGSSGHDWSLSTRKASRHGVLRTVTLNTSVPYTLIVHLIETFLLFRLISLIKQYILLTLIEARWFQEVEVTYAGSISTNNVTTLFVTFMMPFVMGKLKS